VESRQYHEIIISFQRIYDLRKCIGRFLCIGSAGFGILNKGKHIPHQCGLRLNHGPYKRSMASIYLYKENRILRIDAFLISKILGARMPYQKPIVMTCFPAPNFSSNHKGNKSLKSTSCIAPLGKPSGFPSRAV